MQISSYDSDRNIEFKIRITWVEILFFHCEVYDLYLQIKAINWFEQISGN